MFHMYHMLPLILEKKNTFNVMEDLTYVNPVTILFLRSNQLETITVIFDLHVLIILLIRVMMLFEEIRE